MTINVTETESGIKVTYQDADGNEASATVVGESLSSVQDRSDKIADIHDLEAKAKDRGAQ